MTKGDNKMRGRRTSTIARVPITNDPTKNWDYGRKRDVKSEALTAKEQFEIAKRAVIQVGDGRGFIVSAGESRYVITAAHCLPPEKLQTPHLANNWTLREIIGPLASKERTIWAELCVYSLTDDVAAFSEPDAQDLSPQWRRYLDFTEAAMMIGKPPAVVDPYKFTTLDDNPAVGEPDPGAPAWVLSLNGEWQPCTVHNGGRLLRITNHGNNHIVGGMSGDPIIDENGAAIGLISTGNGIMNPILMDCLPPWLRKLDATPISKRKPQGAGDMANRHERRKALVVEKRMMPVSDLAAVGWVCAWDGCEATCAHNENEYLPKGWNVLLVFWSGKPLSYTWDVPPGDMLRDAVLCPEHSRVLDDQLKPLPSRLDRETKGNA